VKGERGDKQAEVVPYQGNDLHLLTAESYKVHAPRQRTDDPDSIRDFKDVRNVHPARNVR
jgi:hypothetical protein